MLIFVEHAGAQYSVLHVVEGAGTRGRGFWGGANRT